MKIRVLGCHGGDFLATNHEETIRYSQTGFLINQTVALDAGTLCGALPLEEVIAVRYILLTHAHLDHTAGLASLSEILLGRIREPVVIISIGAVIDTLRNHFFNDRLWPDFTQIPSGENPIFRYRKVKVGESFELERMKITPIEVNHVVPSVGYVIEEKNAAVVFSGDTFATDTLWKVASRVTTLKAAFIEASFPNELAALAQVAGHLTPLSAQIEFTKLKRPDLTLYLYHMKPVYLAEIKRQVEELKGGGQAILLQEGLRLSF